MTDARDRFLAAADDLGITVDVVGYPAGTRTAQDAAAAIGCRVAQIVKSLVVVVDTGGAESPAVALTSGSRQVDTGALAELIAADRVRMATAEEARARPGSRSAAPHPSVTTGRCRPTSTPTYASTPRCGPRRGRRPTSSG